MINIIVFQGLRNIYVCLDIFMYCTFVIMKYCPTATCEVDMLVEWSSCPEDQTRKQVIEYMGNLKPKLLDSPLPDGEASE